MKTEKKLFKDVLLSASIFVAAFLVNFAVYKLFNTALHVSVIFVLAVFLISLYTRGYFFGVAASVLSVSAVGLVFTYPYDALSVFLPQSVLSFFVMLIISVTTSALTTKIKLQERIKAESEKEKMRANLLRAISHDLRTPLTSIYGSSSAIIENYDSLKKSVQLKLLEEMRGDSEWLIRMVENLLSVTRAQESKVQLTKADVVLEELIDSVLIKFNKRYPMKKVEVSIPDEFITIPVDAILIEQVIINILENAVFHAKGMTYLGLKVYREASRVVFEIRDDGCGIPKDKLPGIFSGVSNPSDNLTGRTGSNMGIGLSVCFTIIKAHGGEISAENLKPQGTLFRFSLETEEDHGE